MALTGLSTSGIGGSSGTPTALLCVLPEPALRRKLRWGAGACARSEGVLGVEERETGEVGEVGEVLDPARGVSGMSLSRSTSWTAVGRLRGSPSRHSNISVRASSGQSSGTLHTTARHSAGVVCFQRKAFLGKPKASLASSHDQPCLHRCQLCHLCSHYMPPPTDPHGAETPADQ